MQKSKTVWYTLGEAEKATHVPRTRLDHACRVGRLQYRRSETGARLLSHDVIEKLRKDGLKSFPRPYDPIASSNEEASSFGSTPGAGLMAQRERVEQKRSEIEEMRVNRDLRQLKYQEQQERAERRAATGVERQAQAEQRAQARLQRQQLRLEEARLAEARDQAAREAEARDRRRQWEARWLDHALRLLPSDTPRSFELDVHNAVAELLPNLDIYQPEQLTLRLIRAAVEKALESWHRQKEVEKIIDETRNQLPIQARSWGRTPNEWEARVMRAAADAIAQLGEDPQLPKIRATAVEAVNEVLAEYEAWKAGEDHRQACEQMVRCVLDGDDAREAVRQALQKLSVGATRTRMENARDAALAPFRAAVKAAADADLYLLHVASHIEGLGNEETGEWDLGDYSERYRLAGQLKAKLRPVLIRKLSEELLDENQAHEFIEEWLDRELELED